MRLIYAIITANNAVNNMWIHEQQNWSNFTWDSETLFCKLADIRY